ncbi:hypothetical protein [Bacillus sp. PS06]|uniref:hypothetical protein n=1 Tax=Bacillus sp. PS06 TaxID=2764176 RepID=UPI00177F9476|nr:hypothetical protein [Bacillus sp. PS06]MBD8069733.1 hypothetical protein [Bacillus sp. PS06]
MDVLTVFIDLTRNIKGFFFNEDGALDNTRVVCGSAVVLLSIGAICYGLYVY